MALPNMRKPASGNAHGLCNNDQLGGKIEWQCKALIGRTQDAQCIHHGGRHIGFIVEARCGLFDAVSIRGGALGRFNGEFAAANAILADILGGADA